MDWIMSVGGALVGTKMQKVLMPMKAEGKVKYVMETFKDFKLTEQEAKQLLKAMDDSAADIAPLKSDHAPAPKPSEVSFGSKVRPQEEPAKASDVSKPPEQVAGEKAGQLSNSETTGVPKIKTNIADDTDLRKIQEIDKEAFDGEYTIADDFADYKADLEEQGVTTYAFY